MTSSTPSTASFNFKNALHSRATRADAIDRK
jgi:hypothetical protein